MNPFLLSLLATEIIRPAWREAASGYLQHPHPTLDPYVLPALKAMDTADMTLSKPVDYLKIKARQGARTLGGNARDVLGGLIQRRRAVGSQQRGASSSY